MSSYGETVKLPDFALPYGVMTSTCHEPVVMFTFVTLIVLRLTTDTKAAGCW
jgi:hypothetical protein